MSSAKKPKTRAQELGVNVKALERRAQRFADRVKAEAEKVAYEWGDVDNTVSSGVDELLAAVAAFRELVQGGVEYLNEIPEDQ